MCDHGLEESSEYINFHCLLVCPFRYSVVELTSCIDSEHVVPIDHSYYVLLCVSPSWSDVKRLGVSYAARRGKNGGIGDVDGGYFRGRTLFSSVSNSIFWVAGYPKIRNYSVFTRSISGCNLRA